MSSTWATIAHDVLGMGLPLLGGVLAGPAGASVGGMVAHALGASVATPAAIASVLGSPEAREKLAALEAEQHVALARIQAEQALARMKADTAAQASVNSTMQAEATSRHWPQWLWRPLNGLLFAPTLIAIYVVLPMLSIRGPSVPPVVWVMWGSLLGITSWHRGMLQRRLAGDATDAVGRPR